MFVDREEVHKLLTRSSDAKGSDAIKKMKNFYDSCLNVEFRYLDLGSFKLTISKLGKMMEYLSIVFRRIGTEKCK